MATPHVAGRGRDPRPASTRLDARQLKDALMSTSKPLPFTAYQVGAGRLDVAASVAATVTATGSAYFGFQGWPHAATGPDRPHDHVHQQRRHRGRRCTCAEIAVDGAPADRTTSTPARGRRQARPPAGHVQPRRRLGDRARARQRHRGRDRPAGPAARNGRRYLGQIVATDATGPCGPGPRSASTSRTSGTPCTSPCGTGPARPASGLRPVPAVRRRRRPDPGRRRRLRRGRRAAAGRHLQRVHLPGRGRQPRPDSLGLALLGDPEIVLDRDRDAQPGRPSGPRGDRRGAAPDRGPGAVPGLVPLGRRDSVARRCSTCCRPCTTACSRCRPRR